MTKNGEQCSWCSTKHRARDPPFTRIRVTESTQTKPYKSVEHVYDLCDDCSKALSGTMQVLEIGAKEYHNVEKHHEPARIDHSHDLPMVA
jgi:hypothetical protein